MDQSSIDSFDVISFDLDGTLIRYERSPGDVLRASFDRLGTEPIFSVDEYVARFDEFADAADSMTELRADCFGALASENGYERGLGAKSRRRSTTNATNRESNSFLVQPVCSTNWLESTS